MKFAGYYPTPTEDDFIEALHDAWNRPVRLVSDVTNETVRITSYVDGGEHRYVLEKFTCEGVSYGKRDCPEWYALQYLSKFH